MRKLLSSLQSFSKIRFSATSSLTCCCCLPEKTAHLSKYAGIRYTHDASVPAKEKPIPKENLEFEIIYHGIYYPKVKALRIFSTITSIGTIAIQPFIFPELLALPLWQQIPFFVGLPIYIFGFPYLLYQLSRRYVKVIFYDSTNDVYAYIWFNFLFKENTVVFRLADVDHKNLDVFCNFRVAGHKILVDADSFLKKSHCEKLLTPKEPIDYKLGSSKTK